MQILFRPWDEESKKEMEIASRHFQTTEFISGVEKGVITMGRYSVVPFYKEIDKEIRLCRDSKLVNSLSAHNYIARMDWVKDTRIKTPKTWFLGDHRFSYDHLPNEGSFVLKGRTNSRKFQWKDRMFAKNRAAVIHVVSSLMNDAEIASQGIAIREYIPLVKLEEGINGMPITNEYRLFFLNGGEVACGYYWDIAEGADEYNKYIASEALVLAQKTADILLENGIMFACIDVAETQSGEWIVIEVNDGQQSGLSCIDPEYFYERLKLATDWVGNLKSAQ